MAFQQTNNKQHSNFSIKKCVVDVKRSDAARKIPQNVKTNPRKGEREEKNLINQYLLAFAALPKNSGSRIFVDCRSLSLSMLLVGLRNCLLYSLSRFVVVVFLLDSSFCFFVFFYVSLWCVVRNTKFIWCIKYSNACTLWTTPVKHRRITQEKQNKKISSEHKKPT